MNTLPFDRFGVMLDCSRNAVRSLPTLKKMVDLLQAMGYNTLMLYMEDTFEVMHQPYFGYLRGRYSIAELQEIDRYARERGMEVVPCIQTLAHINAITRWDCYYQMIDCEDILLIDDERTYRLIDDMMASLAEAFSGRLINVGMDEAYLFGLGKYREEHGDPDRFALFSRHVRRVAEIARKYGFSPMMWSDMYYRCIQGTYIGHPAIPEQVREAVPENMSLVYWDYYSSDRERYRRMIASHREFGRPLWFAGGAWTWNGEVPDNRFAMRSLEAGLTECIQAGIRQAFVTLWGDNGGECSCFAALPALWFARRLVASSALRVLAVALAWRRRELRTVQLVLLSFVVGEHPMALVFNGYELVAVLIAILVANFVVNEGESTWFEGLQLLALYALMGVVFYYA